MLIPAFQDLRDISSPEMSETGRTVPDMNEPPSPLSVLNDPTIQISGTSGTAMSILAQGLTPCFRAVRLRRGFLRGDAELVPVSNTE